MTKDGMSRTKTVALKVTPEERAALDWKVLQDRAQGKKNTRSTLLYEMAQRGNLRRLVSDFHASNSILESNDGDTNGGTQ